MSDARSRRRDAKRAEIIAAAAAVFQETGYDAASMDRISARAEASKRTVYNHFGSKEALFEAVVNAEWGRMQAGEDIAWDPAAPVRAQLRAFADAKARLAASTEQLGLLRVVLGTFILHPELARQTALYASADESSLVRWLTAADAAGALRVPDPARAAHQFWALIKGEVFWPQILGLPSPADSAVDDAIETFLCRYRVGPS